MTLAVAVCAVSVSVAIAHKSDWKEGVKMVAMYTSTLRHSAVQTST